MGGAMRLGWLAVGAAMACGAACGESEGQLPPALDEIDSGFGSGVMEEAGGAADAPLPEEGGVDTLPPDDSGTGGASGPMSDAGEAGDSGPHVPTACMGGAGPAVAVRLSRAEYTRTVRDLLRAPSLDEGSFVPVTDLEGFVAAPQLVSDPSELEDYLGAAERLAPAAMTSLPELQSLDVDDPVAVEGFVRTFGTRAYRRPLTEAEIDRLLAVYAAGAAEVDGRTGVEWLLQGIFSSPNFVYRVEVGDPTRAEGARIPLTGFERASRLSYTFTGTMPDDTLLAAAAAGELDTPEGVRAHAQRLTGSAARVTEFFSEWTGVLATDAALVSRLQRIDAANPDIAQIAADSMGAFVQRVVFESGGSLADLLTTPGIPLDAPLAAALGIPGMFGAEFQFVPTPERPGILAQPGLLAVRSSDTFAGATIRGHFVLEHVFCREVPLPDGTVFSEFPNIEAPLATDRETLEVLHAADGACKGCHTYIDPYGFAFENYDRSGRYRTHQELIPGNVAPVDASGTVVTPDGQFSYDNLAGFAAIVAASELVHECFASQLLTFALRRVPAEQDGCSIEQIAARSLAGGSVLDTFIEATVTESFLYMTPAPTEEI